MKQVTDRFVSKFCTWADMMGYPLSTRRRLPAVLRALPAEFSRRGLDVVERSVRHPFAFRIEADAETSWVRSTSKRLVLGAVGPNWRGLRRMSRDATLGDLVDDFGHFASQYIIRSRIVRAQAALALVYGQAVDFRSADLGRRSHDTVGTRGRRRAPLPTRPSRRSRELHAWMAVLNPLDPFIHRALYQFWRATALDASNFPEDAICALDGVTAVAAEAMQAWTRSVTTTRGDVADALGMTPEDRVVIENMYRLRCAFGAHPPASKWWDFGEVYESEIEDCVEVTKRVIGRLAALEFKHRTINPDPPAWGEWFSMHAELLLDVAWFAKLPA